jgi:hypothetical protein
MYTILVVGAALAILVILLLDMASFAKEEEWYGVEYPPVLKEDEECSNQEIQDSSP